MQSKMSEIETHITIFETVNLCLCSSCIVCKYAILVTYCVVGKYEIMCHLAKFLTL